MAEKNVTLKDLIKDIDFRLTHLEDLEYDNRKLMIKLVKQGNTIVEFLKQLEVTEPPSLEEEMFPQKDPLLSSDKAATIKELVDEYMDRFEDLKEFEEKNTKIKLRLDK